MFHIFGFNVTTLPVFRAGGKVVTLPAFTPEAYMSAIVKAKPSFLHLAPPLAQFLAYSDAVKPEHLETVEYVMVGAAPVGDALAKAFKSKAPNCQFREGK